MENQRELLIRYSIWVKNYPKSNRKYTVEEVVDEFLNMNSSALCNIRFSEIFIKTIHQINDDYDGKVVFCGSFGLVLNDLLDRDVHDIDILTFENHYSDTSRVHIEGSGSGKFFVGGKEVLRFKRIINDIDIDVLYRDDELKYSLMDFHGKQIKVEQPMQAIKSKKQYLESNGEHVNKEKHLEDLETIKNKMGFGNVSLTDYAND